MAHLELISVVDTPIAGMLAAFKQYASIPDDGQDTLLTGILKNAALRVQEYADRAFLSTTLRATVPVKESGIVRLYMGGGTIASVTNERGETVPYTALAGGSIQILTRCAAVTVQYTTVPTEGDQAALKQSILRYATADYDGAETEELNKVLSESVQ